MTRSMNDRPLVIYHANCFDGFTAAWVFRRWLGECDFHPARYGSALPETSGRVVYVVDFSYPRDVMKALIIGSRRTVVLDHHKTAEAALSGLLEEIERFGGPAKDEIVFDMARSGAGIAWDWLSSRPGTCEACGGFDCHQPGCTYGARPWLVDYIEDRDLWRQALPRTREVSAYIAALPMTFEEWDALVKMRWQDVADQGAGIQRYIDTYGSKAREMVRFEVVGGHRIPTVNLPYMNCSEHVGGLAEQYPEAPFAAGYFRRSDGRWQFSLRSRAVFDVSEVAKKFGGGGHAGAAGFEVDRLPWETV